MRPPSGVRRLSLPLLVLRIPAADDPHHTAAADDLAVLADPLYARAYLHDLFRPLEPFARQLLKITAVRR
jgi:hypothetical protein